MERREVPGERQRIAKRGASGGDGPATPTTGAAPLDPEPDDWPTDEDEARALRRSVWVELLFAAVILAITSMLVNTAPARSVSTAPVSLTLRSGSVFGDATIAPGAAGPNDIHITVLSTGGAPIEDMQVQFGIDPTGNTGVAPCRDATNAPAWLAIFTT